MTLEMSIRAITEMCQEDVALIHLPPAIIERKYHRK